MKILIASDKFRGSLTAAEANDAIADGLAASALGARAREPTLVPLADGGEGTLDALSSPTLARRTAPARGPFGDMFDAPFGIDTHDSRAVIELATVAGHQNLAGKPYDPDAATSAGVGDLILAALGAGARHIVVALGGSVNVDGGAGALHALGARFLDSQGNDLGPVGGRSLGAIERVDLTGLAPALRGARITIAADVTNALCGPLGAAAVFGPQKGVAAGDIEAFDAALAHFDRVLAAAKGAAPMAQQAFTGAAGGMMVGLAGAAPVEGRDGFSLVAAHHDIDAKISAADLVATGEGSLDDQSLAGKGPVAIGDMAGAKSVPALAFCGRLAAAPGALAERGLIAFSISPGPQTLDEALRTAGPALRTAATAAFDAVAAGGLGRFRLEWDHDEQDETAQESESGAVPHRSDDSI